MEKDSIAWKPPDGNLYGFPLTYDGWKLEHVGVSGWQLTTPNGRPIVFNTNGGLYAAIDIANLYIDASC